MLKPHEPYNLDKNCKKIPEVKDKNKILEYYKNNYKCVFDTLMNWSKSFVNDEDNNLIIILGDHSINLNKNYKMKNKMNSTFFAYKGPEKCKNLELPKSHVNVMPFILNCIYDLQLDYEEESSIWLIMKALKSMEKLFLNPNSTNSSIGLIYVMKKFYLI